ncbi:DUF2275 domain-containing protein [Mycobacterium sp.]|uniref:DUF2275 domain-containing protein n=1 Tax=Mycobacterium sp. TaxID=1785 RepID=UPI0031D24A0A
MRCEVAREALSARLDGEHHHASAPRVDAHLKTCGACRSWLIGTAVQTRRFAAADIGQAPDLADRIMAAVAGAPAGPRPWQGFGYRRWALIVVGALQVAVAVAQIVGVDFGMVSGSGHGAMTGEHLLHESTAWLLALGAAMIAAGIWPAVSVGVAAIVAAFSLVLAGYVTLDALHGQVTAARMASHLPILVGLVCAVLVAQQRGGARRPHDISAGPADLPLPPDVSRGRRRRHLRPINRSAA